MDDIARERLLKDMGAWLDEEYGADGWGWRVKDVARVRGTFGDALRIRMDIISASNYAISRCIEHEALILDGDIEAARDKAIAECMPIWARRWERFSANQADCLTPWLRAAADSKLKHLIWGGLTTSPLGVIAAALIASGLWWMGLICVALWLALAFPVALIMLESDYVL